MENSSFNEKAEYSRMLLDKFTKSHKKYIVAKYMGAPKYACNKLFETMKKDLEQFKQSTKIKDNE